MKRIYRTPGLSGGFSLIEVMIAVVVLATGLLALAALQASITRASADAKTRGRVAAMLTARMDELRSSGYDNPMLDPGAGGLTTSTTDGCDGDATDWIDCARVQANLVRLDVNQTNQMWTSAVGAASFSQVNARPTTEGVPEFIRVTLNATWRTQDSGATDHTLAMTSEFSSLALRDSLLPPPPASNTPTGGPIVRTDNPAGPGVIPVAVGGGDATAASNPRPEVIGKNNNTTVVGTRFDVLTYSGITGPSVIQRRVETEVIKCQCRLGAGGANLPTIYQKSQWPAIWTGERYDLYTPSPAATPPGQGQNSGPKPNVDQSPYCMDCCRDHFDGTSTTHAKFDPERGGPHNHFTITNAGVLTQMAANDVDYVESCRLIRVDGFWRTAADMYSRQFGLLATETVNGKEAATGLPNNASPVPTVTNYQAFVKSYLEQITGSSGSPPTNAQAKFDETPRGLNEPADVDINLPNSQDFRYLHGRGLYLDFMEAKARAKITKILADTGPNGACPTGSDRAECILPFLPFTTINATELATWKASNTTILSVNSNNQLGSAPQQPSGGRTAGLKKGVADNNVKINMSNFGLAASSDPKFLNQLGVDDVDVAAQGTDTQVFDVGGTNAPPSSGDEFSVNIAGVTTQDPDTFYTVAGTDTGECLRASPVDPFRCATNTDAFSGGSVVISNYWIEQSITQSKVMTCGNKTGTFNVAVPTFYNYEVVSAKIGIANALTLSLGTPNGKITEKTTATFGPELIPGAVVTVTIQQEGSPVPATLASCKITGNNPGTISEIEWTRPWTQP
ncbi:type IV pilus modification PilV family protein [Agrilutibacter solisilvae]|uniref:Prepilin-type N-terminal cleavage/methylation domain-containing protein n=1 Tax=Agrilutibacter solisilvae TaxID=2763317 RepID=A0A974XYU1_9GAMM|nr:prepilin-type N-terminal cleavage/methylation domain-containing protein [Lysobacter solisilvae]QSX78302.1 prepilin-type N-terminal cleavage/methylation domain-containing protein [Lysobacter solisilvae]